MVKVKMVYKMRVKNYFYLAPCGVISLFWKLGVLERTWAIYFFLLLFFFFFFFCKERWVLLTLGLLSIILSLLEMWALLALEHLFIIHLYIFF
jgi:hypothetical protein